MVSKHTPGPWRVELAPDDGLRPIVRGAWELVVGEGNGRMVLAARNPWPNRADESNANAHLICAAPDLLAALKRLLRQNEAMGFSHSDAEEFARGIIAKAEGKP